MSGNVATGVTGTYGSLQIAANGSWTYTLNNSDTDTQALTQGQVVTDVFTYTMTDTNGATSTSTLDITITGTNDTPVAVADINAADVVTEAGVHPGNTAVAGDPTAIGNVLTNDTDVDTGDSKTVIGVAPGTSAVDVSGNVATGAFDCAPSFCYYARDQEPGVWEKIRGRRLAYLAGRQHRSHCPALSVLPHGVRQLLVHRI